jgi:hypothetical protein
LQYFWQSFPKALGVSDNRINISLFPKQFDDDFELQSGEQKTHTIFLDFSGASLNWIQEPLIAQVSPEWIASSEVIPGFEARTDSSFSDVYDVINVALD